MKVKIILDQNQLFDGNHWMLEEIVKSMNTVNILIDEELD